MVIPDQERELVVIAGPTAVGKSALAVELARTCRGTVINADASQLYADLRLLTARPSDADLAAAPHLLYGVVDGAQACSAAEWAELARAAVAATHAAGRLPILVGGSGLYLRTLLDGIAAVPPIDPAVREAVRRLNPQALRAALAAEDPPAAALDPQRAARALEVVRSTGRTLRAWQAAATGGLAAEMKVRAHVVDLPRPELHVRIDTRAAAMLAGGAPGEVAALAARGLAADAPVMKAIGVGPLLAVLRGEVAPAEAAALIAVETKRYAKRQQTWFRNQTPGWSRSRPFG